MASTTGYSNISQLKSFLCPSGYGIPTNVTEEPFLSTLLKILLITDGISIFSIILLNSIVILTILTIGSLRSKSYYKGIACMNVLDFLTGSVTCPIICKLCVTMLKNDDPRKVCIEFQLAKLTGFILSGLTLNAITLLSVERYYRICHALHYTVLFNKMKVLKVSILLVGHTIVVTVLTALGIFIASIILGTAGVLGFVVCCAVMYFRIFKTVRQSAAQLHSKHKQHHMRLSKRLVIIVLVISVCYTPYAVISAIVRNPADVWQYSALYISIHLVLLNSLLNPILFLWQDNVLRKQTCSFLRRIVSPSAGHNIEHSPPRTISNQDLTENPQKPER